MDIKPALLILVAVFIIDEALAQPPKVLVMDAMRLVEIKKKWEQKDKDVLRLVDSLQKQADRSLKMNLVSVMDKQFTPVM